MRLIDADVFKQNMDYVCTMGGWLEPISSAITEYVKKHIDAQTTIDAVEVVRCKDCKWCHYEQDGDIYHCAKLFHRFYDADKHYCSYGERKEHETD